MHERQFQTDIRNDTEGVIALSDPLSLSPPNPSDGLPHTPRRPWTLCAEGFLLWRNTYRTCEVYGPESPRSIRAQNGFSWTGYDDGDFRRMFPLTGCTRRPRGQRANPPRRRQALPCSPQIRERSGRECLLGLVVDHEEE